MRFMCIQIGELHFDSFAETHRRRMSESEISAATTDMNRRQPDVEWVKALQLVSRVEEDGVDVSDVGSGDGDV